MCIADWYQENAETLSALSRTLWEHPEASEKEYTACRLLKQYMVDHGFEIREEHAAGLETAFVAARGKGRPYIGFLAEYDALPGLSQESVPYPAPVSGEQYGHGCGHNLLGTGAAGAAVAAACAMEQNAVPGTVFLFGCPSEEVMLGKIIMAQHHVFDELDTAISWHPGDRNRASEESYQAMLSMEYHFHGKASHAAMAPEEGLSALDAVELMDVGVNYLREHVPAGAQIHYVILNGGDKPNIVPDNAAVWQFIRARSTADLRKVAARMDEVASGAAMMTGTKYTKKVLTGCNETRIVPALVELMNRVMEEIPAPHWSEEEEQYAREILQHLGRTPEELEAGFGEGAYEHPLHAGHLQPTGRTINILGSSDLSDVSYIVPTCMLFAACYPYGTPNHSWAVTACTGMSIGQKGMLYASQVMAETGFRLARDSELLKQVRESFQKALGASVYEPVR